MLLSQNQKHFLNFFLHFWNLPKIWNTLNKIDEPRKLFVSEIIDCKNRGYLNATKSPVSEHLWTVNMLKGPKDCLILHGSIFVIFSGHSETKSSLLILFY